MRRVAKSQSAVSQCLKFHSLYSCSSALPLSVRIAEVNNARFSPSASSMTDFFLLG